MLSVYTPAKVNLFLNVLGRRKDGFHELCSLMQAIGLWDRLDVTPRLKKDGTTSPIRFRCNLPALEQDPQNNLLVRAYYHFWQQTGLPPLALDVFLEKGIPLQAGLGGGSSDAAAMLLVLDHLAHTHLGTARLRQMATALGSDVPFFISGGRAWATGRGEIIEPLPNDPSAWPLILVKPRMLGSETAAAYRSFVARQVYRQQSPDDLLIALNVDAQQRRQEPEASFSWDQYLFNDFESVLYPQHPVLEEIVRKLKQIGVRRPFLCGSGSAMGGFIQADALQMRDEIRPALLKQFNVEHFQVLRTQTWAGGVVQAQGSMPK
jgi:4-diphosphocytidyl-2-C-methyl-D-erythritol kinase